MSSLAPSAALSWQPFPIHFQVRQQELRKEIKDAELRVEEKRQEKKRHSEVWALKNGLLRPRKNGGPVTAIVTENPPVQTWLTMGQSYIHIHPIFIKI